MRFRPPRRLARPMHALAISALLAVSAGAHAGTASLQQIVHARQEHFHMLGRTAKSLRDQIVRSHPDWTVVSDDAHRLQQLAAQLPSWFPAGSGQGHGVKTRARALIWRDPRAFARAAHALFSRARDLSRAAATHDRRTMLLEFRALGHACGSCHSRFRAHGSWW
jgi:cytochrome c556